MAKVLSEWETRKNLLAHAKAIGAEGDLIQFFNKYDKLLRECKNEQERKQISIMANAELYRALGCFDGLSVDNQVIIEPSNLKDKDKIII